MAKENYVLLRRITVSATGFNEVIFDNIPQDGYTDLKLEMSVRTERADYTDQIGLVFNSTPSSYSDKRLYGYGTGAASDSGSSTFLRVARVNANLNTANTFSNGSIYIPNYTSSNHKSISVDNVYENNTASNAYCEMYAGLWSNTAAIFSIKLYLPDASFLYFAVGTSFSLYGIANATTTPAISPKAFGGDIIKTDGTYWYHAFLSSGIFTAQTNINADILVLQGGGGGSNSGGIGSGGGAGAINYQSSQSISTGSSNAVIVGAGGAKDMTSVGDGQSGSESSFGSIVANVINKAKGSNSSSGRVGGDGGNTLRRTNLLSFPYSGGLGAASSYPRRGGSGAGSGSDGSSSYPAIGGNGSNAWSSWATATGTGSSGYYAGGGAGGYEYNGSMSRTAGGLGGGGMGGAGTSNPNYNATDGSSNTGGGGGGCGGQSGVIGGSSGNGGSGIVIIRYPV